jgi:NTE family protein
MKRAIALSGGGSNILFHAGVLKYLKAHDIKIDVAYGVSSGALAAVMLGQDKTEELNRIVETVRNKDVYRKGFLPLTLFHALFGRLYLYNNSPLWKLLDREARGAYTIPVGVGVVDISGRGRFEVQENTVEDFNRYVIASTAIPLVFPPVKIKGDYFVDGGLLHVNPLGELIDRHDPDEIIIVNTYISELRDLSLGRPKNAIDYAGKLLRIVMAHAMNDDIHRFLHINRMVEESGVPLYSPSGKRYKYFKCRLIEALRFTGDSIDFTNADRRLIQHGYDVAGYVFEGV